jgi:hypothetical protein
MHMSRSTASAVNQIDSLSAQGHVSDLEGCEVRETSGLGTEVPCCTTGSSFGTRGPISWERLRGTERRMLNSAFCPTAAALSPLSPLSLSLFLSLSL